MRGFRRHTWLGLATVCFAIALLAAHTSARAGNERFEEMLKRGVVRVGVQQALKPWGFRDPSGKLIGLEVDLAQDVADTLGVKLETVPIESSNRMQFLQQGKIDIIIGSMGDTPDRRKVVGMVRPHYFSDGTNIIAKTGAVKSWEDLRGKPVCSKQGMTYGKSLETDVGAQVVAFTGVTEALQALRNGKCVATITNDGEIPKLLASGEWAGYEMPVESRYITYWAVGVPLEEINGIWGTFMAGMVFKWHASGRLLELHKKWDLTVIPFFKTMHDKYEPDDK
jgi:polar amino acid transport system substrate-binding protein